MEPGYLRIEPEQLTEGLRGMMTVYYGEGEWLCWVTQPDRS